MVKDRRAEERQALEHLLEVYGADRTRWPARERLRFASVIAEDAEAKRLLAEATALGSLLDLAPRASEARERALQERIVAKAVRTSDKKLAVVGGRAPDPAALRLPVERSATGRLSGRSSGRFADRFSGRALRDWPAAAVLAASLMIGVYLGSAGTLDTALQQAAEATGLTAVSDTSHVALGEEIVGTTEEDLL
jgi:hypothetical protein